MNMKGSTPRMVVQRIMVKWRNALLVRLKMKANIKVYRTSSDNPETERR